MANLYYTVPFEVLQLDNNQNIITTFSKEVPYFKKIKTYLEDVWTNANIQQYLPDNIKNKIKHIAYEVLPPSKFTYQIHMRLTIEPIKGFYWTDKRRIQIYNELDAQIADGFGETLQFKPIPNISECFVIQF